MTSIWYIKVLHTLPGRARHQQWGRRGNRSSENNRSKNRHVNLRFHSSSCELEVNRENGTKRDIQAKRLQLLRGYEHMKEVSIIKKPFGFYRYHTGAKLNLCLLIFINLHFENSKCELKFEALRPNIDYVSDKIQSFDFQINIFAFFKFAITIFTVIFSAKIDIP